LAAGTRDLTIQAPQEQNLSAPPYVSPVLTVTYGEQVTLLQARDSATAVNPEVSSNPIPPGRGYRWVGLRLRMTNTGSADAGRPIPLITGSNGQHYYGSDATLPGCAQLAVFPPESLAPGQTITACDTYLLPDRVAVRMVTINMGGFANPAANGFWQITSRPLPRPAHPMTYAALGDSYSSGEGSGNYDAHPLACHRGADAWPRLVTRQLPHLVRMPHGALVACSAAISANLTGHAKGQPNQLQALRKLSPHPALVTITMGGNDIHFVPILIDCVLSPVGCGNDGTIQRAEAAIPDEQQLLVKDYTSIRKADPSAVILAVGYPRLFPQDQKNVVPTCAPWLTDDVRLGLNQLDADLNAVIHAAAAQTGTRYVDVSNVLSGHEACTAHSWIFRIGLTGGQQRGHPTKPGQQAIANAVESYLHQHL
jgi:lysophospholipase L1-like esterase